MKSGEYAIYNGKEYKAGHLKDDNYILISFEPDELKNGFEEVRPGRFIKEVKKSLLQAFYVIYPLAIYKGRQVGIVEEKDGQVLIGTSGSKVYAEKYGFLEVDRGDYEKWVNRNELEKMWEDKESYF